MNAQKYKRRSIRLAGYDYAQHGMYFITLCVEGMQGLLGTIESADIRISPYGAIVEQCWRDTGARYPSVYLADYVIMPNHFLALVHIENETPANFVRAGAGRGAVGDLRVRPGVGTGASISLSEIIQRFKSLTTHAYMQEVKVGHFLPFKRRVWHRGYYEHIVRNEEDLARIREYIANNPIQWELEKGRYVEG